MALTLDPAIEARIQRQVERGGFSAPSELLAHALDLVEAEDEWLLRNRDAVNRDLEESFGQAALLRRGARLEAE